MAQTLKQIYLPIFLLFLIVGACSEISTYPTGQDSIIGKWQWLQTSGGIDARVFTPESEGIQIAFDFSKDSVQYIFIDDSLRASYAFSTNGDTLRRVESGFDQLFQIENDQLTLTDLVVDGFTSIYAKIK